MRKLVLYVLFDLVVLVLGAWAVMLPPTHVGWIDYPAYAAMVVAPFWLIFDVRKLYSYRKANQPWS